MIAPGQLTRSAVVLPGLPYGGPCRLPHGGLAPASPERTAVVTALQALPERQRESLVLRYYADLSPAQTASVMGISVGEVKSHTARAMAALRAVLDTSG
jgi:DNA-directed RNA polymerase specialized sigma24 family protein